jgi:hypothetical protein
VQQQADLGITFGESRALVAEHNGPACSRDGERPGVLAFEFRADPLQIVQFLQRPPCGQTITSPPAVSAAPPTLPNENRHAQLVLELPDLLADARL